jgi:hypothetical protein
MSTTFDVARIVAERGAQLEVIREQVLAAVPNLPVQDGADLLAGRHKRRAS